MASRIELVDPGDLLRSVARRRAVFVWQDVVRLYADLAWYAVQKLHASCATLVPPMTVRVPQLPRESDA